ncbi:hypothetical protein M1271_07490 [Patescibacteria group bacterium]|nr:hypothetical protein [Patescibacteria group bacterium]MCL5797618.1 hypothetical protein [Patescibacteria group bacterium]
MSNPDGYNYQKIAYLGIPGSYSYVAVHKYMKNKKNMTGAKSIKEVFGLVDSGKCTAGIVPLENTTTGSIYESYDALIDTGLRITAEIILSIHHHVLGVDKGISEDNFRKVQKCLSHPQAISQCGDFLSAHPWIKPVFTTDTASAAKEVARCGKSDIIAIAGKEAADIYNLTILGKNIETVSHNYTRFIKVQKNMNKSEGNKISLAFSVRHVPGSLSKVLDSYAHAGLNLTKIESRPVFGRPWEYIFFLEFDIGNKGESVENVLTEMKENTNFLTVLGRFPKGKIYET